MLMNTINGGDALRPLVIWSRAFANTVRDIIYHKRCTSKIMSPFMVFYHNLVNKDNNLPFLISKSLA